MSMWAPEPAARRAPAAVRYFVDYEVWVGGQAIGWGQLIQAGPPGDALPGADAAWLHDLQQRAAERHGVAAGEVRIRTLARL